MNADDRSVEQRIIDLEKLAIEQSARLDQHTASLDKVTTILENLTRIADRLTGATERELARERAMASPLPLDS